MATVITFFICFQAFMNLGVVSGFLPSTGLNLPFFSQGGTSLMANIMGLGLLLDIARHKKELQKPWSMPHVVITAGGTGGHLYPAQALAEQFTQQPMPHDVLFVAGGLRTNRNFDRTRFSFQEITCSPFVSRHPLKSLKGMQNLCRGIDESVAILRQFKPDVVVGFGSFYTVSAVLAARWLKIPIILHEANSIPGKANQWLSPLPPLSLYVFPRPPLFQKEND